MIRYGGGKGVRGKKRGKSMLSRLWHHPAVLFHFAEAERLAEIPSARLGRTWIGLLATGFLWGLACLGLWHGSNWMFGQSTGLFLLPNLLVTAAALAGMHRRGAVLLIRAAAGEKGEIVALTTVLLAMGFWGCLLEFSPAWYLTEPSLPYWLAWIRPDSKLDRLLLLMPLWGAWSMLILPQFHRPSAEDPALCAIVRGAGPLTAAAVMGGLLAASIGSFAYLPWTQLTIPAAAVLAALLGGTWLVRRRGGLDRDVLLATNLLTQCAVLLTAAANHHVIMSP